MRVTDVQVKISRRAPGAMRPDSQDGATLAYATVVLDGQLKARGLRLREDWRGLSVAYPDMFGRDGERHGQWFHPVSPELRAEIEDAVIAEYRSALACGRMPR